MALYFLTEKKCIRKMSIGVILYTLLIVSQTVNFTDIFEQLVVVSIKNT